MQLRFYGVGQIQDAVQHAVNHTLIEAKHPAATTSVYSHQLNTWPKRCILKAAVQDTFVTSLFRTLQPGRETIGAARRTPLLKSKGEHDSTVLSNIIPRRMQPLLLT